MYAETAAFVVGAVAGYHATSLSQVFARSMPQVKGHRRGARDCRDVFEGVQIHMPQGDAATEILAMQIRSAPILS
jgi:hypothetical protein